MNSKVIDGGRLEAWRAVHRKQGQSVVFTNGCFDILHVGHVRYLRDARAQGDMLMVGLNSDQSVGRIKGPLRPLNTQHDRAEVLCGLSCVDYVVVFDEDTPETLIRRIRPDVLVKGADWALRDIVGADIVSASGGRVARIPVVPGISTTLLIERIVHRFAPS